MQTCFLQDFNSDVFIHVECMFQGPRCRTTVTVRWTSVPWERKHSCRISWVNATRRGVATPIIGSARPGAHNEKVSILLLSDILELRLMFVFAQFWAKLFTLLLCFLSVQYFFTFFSTFTNLRFFSYLFYQIILICLYLVFYTFFYSTVFCLV